MNIDMDIESKIDIDIINMNIEIAVLALLYFICLNVFDNLSTLLLNGTPDIHSNHSEPKTHSRFLTSCLS